MASHCFINVLHNTSCPCAKWRAKINSSYILFPMELYPIFYQLTLLSTIDFMFFSNASISDQSLAISCCSYSFAPCACCSMTWSLFKCICNFRNGKQEKKKREWGCFRQEFCFIIKEVIESWLCNKSIKAAKFHQRMKHDGNFQVRYNFFSACRSSLLKSNILTHLKKIWQDFKKSSLICYILWHFTANSCFNKFIHLIITIDYLIHSSFIN